MSPKLLVTATYMVPVGVGPLVLNTDRFASNSPNSVPAASGPNPKPGQGAVLAADPRLAAVGQKQLLPGDVNQSAGIIGDSLDGQTAENKAVRVEQEILFLLLRLPGLWK